MYGAKAGKRPLKRPLRSWTVHEKLNAITRVMFAAETKASVARDIGVPESTLRGWCKNHENISKQAGTSASSPEDTPESHHIAKRFKLENHAYNLSMKTSAISSGSYSPNSESEDRKSREPDSDTSPLNSRTAKPADSLLVIDSTPKSSINNRLVSGVEKESQDKEREKTRAELARLSAELGLISPEMLLSTWHFNNLPQPTMALMESTNVYQSWFYQQQALQRQKQTSKVGSPTDLNATTSLNDVVALRSDPIQNGNQKMQLWNWYQQSAYSAPQMQTALAMQPQLSPLLPDNQQLTKEETPKNSNKSVLDNLLFNNSTIECSIKKEDGVTLNIYESLEHATRFLCWLEHCVPTVTTSDLHVVQNLVKSWKTMVDCKNSDCQNRNKVRRK